MYHPHFYGGSKVRLQDATATACFPLQTFWLLVRRLRSEAWTSAGGLHSNDEYTRGQETLGIQHSKGLSAHRSGSKDSGLRLSSTFLFLPHWAQCPSLHPSITCPPATGLLKQQRPRLHPHSFYHQRDNLG